MKTPSPTINHISISIFLTSTFSISPTTKISFYQTHTTTNSNFPHLLFCFHSNIWFPNFKPSFCFMFLFRFNFQFIININICDIYDIKKNIKKKHLLLNNFQIINFIFFEKNFLCFPHPQFQFQPSPICFMFRVMFILFFKLNNLFYFLVLVSGYL